MMTNTSTKVLLMTTLSLLTVACVTAPSRFSGADQVRERFNTLQGDQRLAALAPIAMQEARIAVSQAEQSSKEPQQAIHLVVMAERKVDIAEAEAQRRYLEDQRNMLKTRRDNMQLDARTNESKWAKIEANQARDEALEAKQQATQAQQDAALAQQNLNQAEQQTAKAQKQVKDIQQQLDELDARQSSRGAVVTLGDLLFDFNQSRINPAALGHLAKLAEFLNNNPERHATIEGHTDNVGAAEFNMRLSQRRADAVQGYLLSQGVALQRMESVGKGAGMPVTNNQDAAARQQNRRVEVIISNTST
jgi:outer membrane protein OmpA-like peptidoglycan-associated protein